ncbi:hypothetical protein NUW54_g60 [Trametes sanguinea]|uniref:Uncharacterized protein n=1 Tax=Trametes sanguinea TaxID=158606 RepID=A0ACC1QBM4_9APHY|nr:hypothetical protein NUW54_g60 [Trametes sanguinea]
MAHSPQVAQLVDPGKRTAWRSEAETKRELSFLRSFLSTGSQFEMPLWVGHLLSRVGEPANGSLSADEYKSLITGSCVLVVPIIWEKCQETATNEHKQVIQTYKKDIAAWRKAMDELKRIQNPEYLRGPGKGQEDSTSTTTSYTSHAPCKLSVCAMDLRVCCVLDYSPMAHCAAITETDLRSSTTAQSMISGPFLAERLNKLMKDFNLNNWSGRQLEITMIRAFYRTSMSTDLIQHAANLHPSDPSESSATIAQYLLKDAHGPAAYGTVSAEAQGTVPGSEDSICNIEPQHRRGLTAGLPYGKPIEHPKVSLAPLFKYYNSTLAQHSKRLRASVC